MGAEPSSRREDAATEEGNYRLPQDAEFEIDNTGACDPGGSSTNQSSGFATRRNCAATGRCRQSEGGRKLLINDDTCRECGGSTSNHQGGF